MRISDWSSDVCSSDLTASNLNSRLNLLLRIVALRKVDMIFPRAVRTPGLGSGNAHDVWRWRAAGCKMKCSLCASMYCSIATPALRSEEHTSELQSLMRNSYAVLCLKNKIENTT